jgi:hypothetical protein
MFKIDRFKFTKLLINSLHINIRIRNLMYFQSMNSIHEQQNIYL